MRLLCSERREFTITRLRRKGTLVLAISGISPVTVIVERERSLRERCVAMPSFQDDRPSADELWNAFTDPSDDARPRVWWHWMDGNIDPRGIVRDLTWLHGIGVRGVQMFDGGMGVPLVVPAAVRPGSGLWTEAIDTAVRTANDLGLEFSVATSSGWSAAGGPWVTPQDAMKKVVWSESVIDGGGFADVLLAPLPAVAGPYQDASRWGGSTAAGFSQEWVVLAVPSSPGHVTLTPESFAGSADLGDPACLIDGSFADSLSLPRDPDGRSEAWIEQRFGAPVTVRSVVVGLPGPRGFGAAPLPNAVLQASDDGAEYRDVAVLDATSAPARSASFAPVTARFFRLVLAGAGAADALPPVADGVRIPPVLRRAHEFLVSEFALRPGGRVHHAEAKAGFSVVPDYYAVDTDPRADYGAIRPESVVDLTRFVTAGVLRWDAPPARWRILRIGASLTGHVNGPAPADSTGLEVDKLDGARVAEYLKTHLSRLGDRAESISDSSRFDALLSDSIESGAQNWTDRILEHFEQRRGYNALPWLPALAGYLVGSADESDRFLFDYRRTLAELFSQEYYGTLADEAHRRGMLYYAEALEDGRPQLGDDLAMRGNADVPMGAMWTFDPTAGPRPTYVADLKGASSASHVYGRRWTGSEAFTSFDQPWSWSPQRLKHIADLQLSLGVNRFSIHTSPHQPVSAPPPGISLAPFLGQAFTVNETWSDMAGPWIDYLARCSALLSQGSPAVDIAVFVGEEAPVTGLFNDAFDDSVPPGFDFDYVGADALRDILRVENGQVVSAGVRYRLLYLGGSTHRMTMAALAQIERLLDAGATVVGVRPTQSPSLADDPSEFETVCDRLWGTGRVIAATVGEAIQRLGLRPALVIEGGATRSISRIVAGKRLTFVSNPAPEAIHLTLTTNDGSPLIGWDPIEVRRRPLPGEGGLSRLALAPFGSIFLLHGDGPAEGPPAHTAESGWPSMALDGAWRIELPEVDPASISPRPEPWTEMGPLRRAFSGTGVYCHEFSLTDHQAGARTQSLTLESVHDIARVEVNGIDCGVLWTPPFRAEIAHATRPGTNRIRIHVATPWRNRLIAEATHPSGEIFAPMTAVFEKDATPLTAGLDGPVLLQFLP